MMKHYEKLVEMGCFAREELVELTGNSAAANSIIYDYQKKGYIERIRHNLYAVMSIESRQPILSRYQIGSRLFEDAYISHHSAFEVYGYANQVFYETYVGSSSRFLDFEYNGIFYHRLAPKCGVQIEEKNNGIRMTSLERTVVDSIHDLEKIAGLEEIVRCIALIPVLNAGKLLEVLACYQCGFLYQKCGYLLESMNDSLSLPQAFFDECTKYISKSKRYLIKGQEGFVWHDRWNLYAPESIRSLIDKGVDNYDAI